MSFVANYSELPFSRMTWGLGWGLEHSYCNALLYLFVPGSVYFQTQIKQSYSALDSVPQTSFIPVVYKGLEYSALSFQLPNFVHT